MVRSIITTFTAILAVFGYANATCHLENSLSGDPKPETREALCQKHPDEDSWTIAMTTSLIAVPTFDGGNALAGAAGSFLFIIYDHECVPKGAYGRNGPDCGIPFQIDEDWLNFPMVIHKMFAVPGGTEFKFHYGDTERDSNGANGDKNCGCSDISSGLEGKEACNCQFLL